MAKRYTRINWQNKPNTATPISAENLNKMDKGIKDCDDAIGDLALLNTNNKTDLVSAINEQNNNLANLVTLGTWTPALNLDSVTYTAQWGRYVKIGNQVTLYFYIYGNVSTPGSGILDITGLPFAAANIGNARFAGIVSSYNVGSITDTLTLFMQDNFNVIRIYRNGKTLLGKQDFIAGIQFVMGQITYLTN